MQSEQMSVQSVLISGGVCSTIVEPGLQTQILEFSGGARVYGMTMSGM